MAIKCVCLVYKDFFGYNYYKIHYRRIQFSENVV